MDLPQAFGHGWISLLDQDILDDVQHPAQIDASLQLHSNGSYNSSAEIGNTNMDSICQGQNRKRAREDCLSGVKACREKMRRDRLNDRFMELSAVLEPEKPPKTDKASILHDAIRILNQLRGESQQLKDANQQLQEVIKELKAEKGELREEKLLLKSDKERLENQLRNAGGFPGYVPHPAAVHSMMRTASHSHLSNTSASMSEMPAVMTPENRSFLVNKSTPVTEMHRFGMTMSQWMPATTTDCTNDHILRPPIA